MCCVICGIMAGRTEAEQGRQREVSNGESNKRNGRARTNADCRPLVNRKRIKEEDKFSREWTQWTRHKSLDDRELSFVSTARA